MIIEYLQNFIQLTQYKSFSRLAEEISISQSTLSHRISQLEKELGNITLIERTTKSFELTEMGKVCLNYAKKIVSLFNECKEEINKLSQSYTEEIVISASKLPGSQILPKYFAEFKNSNPQVNFEIVISNSRSSINLLRKDLADFAGIGSFMNSNKQDFDSVIIGTDELYFVCSPSHEILKKFGREVSFEIIKKYPFIQREEGSGTRDIFENKFPEHKTVNLTLELNDNDSIITAVSESNYISVLSKDIAKKAKNSGLIEIIKIKEYPIIAKRNLFFIKLKEKKLTDLKANFWEYLKKSQDNSITLEL